MRTVLACIGVAAMCGAAWADCGKSTKEAAKGGCTAASTAAKDECAPNKGAVRAVTLGESSKTMVAQQHERTISALEHARHSFTDAIAIMHRELPSAKLTEARLDWCGDVPVFELEAHVGNGVIKEVTIDARTGALRDIDNERVRCRETAECTPQQLACLSPDIDLANAMDLARRQFEGFRPVSTELEWESERAIYTVKMLSDTHWASVTLDANNGSVLLTQRGCKSYFTNGCPAMDREPGSSARQRSAKAS